MIVVTHPLIGTAYGYWQTVQIGVATKYIKLIPHPQLIYHIGNALYGSTCFIGRMKPGDGDEDFFQ
jgi:hypothetical protein